MRTSNISKRFLKIYSSVERSQEPAHTEKEERNTGISQDMNTWDVLRSAHNAWQSLAGLRQQIRRNEEFVFGDQHSDRVYDYASGRVMTERQLLMLQGLQPSQYNVIRGILRSVTGVWGSNKTLPNCIAQKDGAQEESDILTATLHAHYRKHELWKMDMHQLLQLTLSGIVVSKSHYTKRFNTSDVYTDYVDINSFFVDNTIKDPRYLDCSIVGSFHDLPIRKIAAIFAKGDPQRAKRIRMMYNSEIAANPLQYVEETFTDQRVEPDFFTPEWASQDMGRVIEVWRREVRECYWIHDRLNGEYFSDFTVTESQLQELNNQRIAEQLAMGVAPEDMKLYEWDWSADEFIFYYYITPWGDLLDSGLSPYWHEKFPYTFEIHDFSNGKIIPFVKDLIDTQKQINKLSAISELLTKYSAKSLLFLPMDQIAEEDGYGVDYIQRAVTSYDAIIPYKAKPGQDRPFYQNTVPDAFTPLNVVNMYLELSERVSGVYGALQGQQPTAGTPAQMYAQQSQNSATSLTPLFEAMNSYRTRRDKLNVQLMQQYYEDDKYIYNSTDSKNKLVWKQDKVKNIDFEIAVVENTDTPAYRLMLTDLLFKLKEYDTTGVLDIRGLVEAGNLPFKEHLLNYLNKREEEMREAMQGGGGATGAGGMPIELQEQLQNYQFNPEVQQLFQNLPKDVQAMFPGTRNYGGQAS